MSDSDARESKRWSTTNVVLAIALFFAFLILLRFLWISRTVLIVAFLGVLFGLALSAGVDWLERWQVRRGLGAAALTIAFLGVLVGLGALIAPTLRDQAGELQEKLPQSLDQIESLAGPKERRAGADGGRFAGTLGAAAASSRAAAGSAGTSAFPAATSCPAAAGAGATPTTPA